MFGNGKPARNRAAQRSCERSCLFQLPTFVLNHPILCQPPCFQGCFPELGVCLCLRGGCSSSCICFPVFICSYPRVMTQRGAELLRSSEVFEWAGSKLTGHFPEWGWGCLTRWNTHAIWTCYNTNICIPLCSIAAECYEIMEGSDLAPHCMKITMNEQVNRKMLFQIKMLRATVRSRSKLHSEDFM